MRITVLGGGNGSYAAAADLAGLGHDVTLWRRDRQALQAVLATRRLTLKDVSGVRDVILSRVTADIGKAVRGAELIVAPPELCTDNAAMGAIAWEKFRAGSFSPLDLDIEAGLDRIA